MNQIHNSTYNLWGLFSHLDQMEDGEQSRALAAIATILKIDPCVDFDFKSIETIMLKSHSVATRTKAFNILATVVCLVPAHTDTAWWHDYAQHGETRFIRGRLKFGGCKNGAPFPSAIVIFRGAELNQKQENQDVNN